MKTAQLLLQERIATGYVMQRVREADPTSNARVNLDAEKLWLSQLQEFNRTLEKNSEKILNEILLIVQGILKEVLPKISNPEERKAIRLELAEKFSEIEL